MLYEELSNLCPDCTYEQYEAIERIYNACPSMSKEDSAQVWRMTYGVEVEQEKRDAENLKEQLCNCTVSERDIRYFARAIQDATKEDIFCNTIKSRGVHLRRALINNINNGSVLQYALEYFDGKEWTRTAYRYSTPDFYVWMV